ncbi:MAG: hypothetical protein V2J24_20110 [Pseudomonadales bacterium]|jgi:hypothetical protein|nr:hypothetical protein [Pseudomonadales bacterium]
MKRSLVLCLLGAFALAGCESTPTTAQCTGRLGNDLDSAAREAEERLASGCTYHFDDYFAEMLSLAEANPSPENRVLFSDFLVGQQQAGTISRRQARAHYNRYFGVKFVSLQGDYNTCSQTCPVRESVLADMRTELQHKERGLLRASEDSESFYRADTLLKEAELVLEATCRACEAGGI